jgi:hypothetical protein
MYIVAFIFQVIRREIYLARCSVHEAVFDSNPITSNYPSLSVVDDNMGVRIDFEGRSRRGI